MKTRGAVQQSKRLWPRRAFWLLLPLFLVAGVWEVRQLQLPIEVEIPLPGLQREQGSGFSVKKQKIPAFQRLIARLIAEHRQHPFAASISISQITPWPKESGLDLFFAESLEWKRAKATLRYTTDNYGWTYSHVENKGLDVLARANLQNDPITLPAPIHARLRSRGWTLTEHYLP